MSFYQRSVVREEDVETTVHLNLDVRVGDVLVQTQEGTKARIVARVEVWATSEAEADELAGEAMAGISITPGCISIDMPGRPSGFLGFGRERLKTDWEIVLPPSRQRHAHGR